MKTVMVTTFFVDRPAITLTVFIILILEHLKSPGLGHQSQGLYIWELQ